MRESKEHIDLVLGERGQGKTFLSQNKSLNAKIHTRNMKQAQTACPPRANSSIFETLPNETRVTGYFGNK